MDVAIAAALSTTIGFSLADVATALFAKRVSGRTTMLVLTVLKLLIYIPFFILWWPEFASVSAEALLWIIPLGIVFTIAYFGFNLGLEVGNPALVGVIAGSFPAVATAIAIIFLGQRPSILTLCLIGAVVVGVICIGLPKDWRKSFAWDKGILYALLPMIGWGIVTGFLGKTISIVGTDHGWFVVQGLMTVVMVLITCTVFNRKIVPMVCKAHAAKVWWLVAAAAVAVSFSEAMQALALGAGPTILTIGIIGAYPAVYFLIAHQVFKEPLYARQWVGIAAVAVAVVCISIGV